jgi:hypothetical protein
LRASPAPMCCRSMTSPHGSVKRRRASRLPGSMR